MSNTTSHPSFATLNHISTGNLVKAKFANYKFLEHVFPTLSSLQSSPPLNFGVPEILTINSNPSTYLTNTEITKLINLKALAKNVPDGFSTEERIIQNAIPGAGNTLPQKRPPPKPSTKRTPNNLKFILQPSH